MWKKNAIRLVRRRVTIRQVVFFFGVLALVLAAYMYGRSQSPAGVSGDEKEAVDLYVEALNEVQGDYVDRSSIDPKKEAYGAIKGMLDSLGDKGHTRFLTPEEVQKNHEAISSKYVGIGVRIENKDDEVVVTSPIDGSPAKAAGIKSGDVLVAVDGENVKGEDLAKVSGKIRGPEGSQVDLTMLRDGEERDFSVERSELEVPPVTWALIPGTDTADLRLVSFSKNSADKLDEAITEAQNAGAKSFVLDLRDNPGGLVNQAEKIAARFLPSGSGIYVQKDADGTEKATNVPDGNDPLNAPMVVLVNGGSASCAEILAGALRDDARATVVGQKTFGTGTVLSERDLSDGSSILLGIAEWLTPNGDFIRGSGIEPDVEAKLGKDQQPRTPDEYNGSSREEIFAQDAQLEQAYETLQGE